MDRGTPGDSHVDGEVQGLRLRLLLLGTEVADMAHAGVDEKNAAISRLQQRRHPYLQISG